MEEKSVNELMDEMEVLQDELAAFQALTAEYMEERRGTIHEEEAHLNEELAAMERRKREISEEATALKVELDSFDKLEAKRKVFDNKKTLLARMKKEIEDRASKLLDGEVPLDPYTDKMGTKLWLVKRNKYQWPCYVVSRVDETQLEVKMFDKEGKEGNLRTVEQTNVQPYLYDESLKKKVAESNYGDLKAAFLKAERIVGGE